MLPFLDPLQRWEISQPGNVLRVFERGSRKKPEVGNPKPRRRAGQAGDQTERAWLGTELRTDPVFLGLQKTRLFDPLLSFPGTNDQAGDYRASGCSACHVVYANDRSPNIPELMRPPEIWDRPQPPIPPFREINPDIPFATSSRARFRPASAWSPHASGDEHGRNLFRLHLVGHEIDGEHMWPAEQRNPSAAEQNQIQARNPERCRRRGRVVGPGLPGENRHPEFNRQLQHTQFAT